MKTLNWIRRIVWFPLGLVMFLPFAIAGFFLTDFENEGDRDYFEKTLRGFFK